jgi:hypothetical protein
MSILELSRLLTDPKLADRRAKIKDATILQTLQLAQDIAGDNLDELRPEFIIHEVEQMSAEELEQQAKTALLKALNQGGAISVSQLAKLQADPSISARDVARMLMDAEQQGLINKKEKKTNALVANALVLAPQIVAGSDGAKREIVANGIESRLRKSAGEHLKFKKATATMGKTNVNDDNFEADLRTALMKGLNAARLVTNPSDPKWVNMSPAQMAQLLADAPKPEGRNVGLVAKQAIRFAEAIAAGDEDAMRSLVAFDKVYGGVDDETKGQELSSVSFNNEVKQTLIDALVKAGMIDANDQDMTAEQAAKLLAAADRTAVKVEEHRERAEMEKEATALEELAKRQLEAMMILTQKINQLGGTADPKSKATPPPPIIEWIRERDENAERLAAENRSVILWERELARWLDLEHKSASSVANITKSLSESHFDDSAFGLIN